MFPEKNCGISMIWLKVMLILLKPDNEILYYFGIIAVRIRVRGPKRYFPYPPFRRRHEFGWIFLVAV